MKRFSIVFVLLLTFKLAFPQGDVIDFIKAGKNDAQVLFKNYLDPYAMALGEGLNNGWFQTAETHKFLGFDISLNMSAIQIPSDDLMFDLNGLSFTNMELVNPNNSLTPTVAGIDQEGPEIRVFREPNNPSSDELFTFNAPMGADLDLVPVPMAQISFGLIPHTDIVARYVPELEFSSSDDDVTVGLKGIGLKHNFKEWIPLFKKLPFDAAVYFTYAKIYAETGFTFTDADYDLGSIPPANIQNDYVHNDDQVLEFDTQAMKYGLIVSKKVGILTVFGSVGNNKTETNIDLVGTYPILEDDQANDKVIIKGEKDPISIDLGSSTNIAYNAGLRLKLAFFKIFASVNKAEYTSYNAGIALGVR